MVTLTKDRLVSLLLAALIVGVLATGILGGLYWRAQSQDQILDERRQTLIENVGRLRLLDETLTMSAKLAAAAEDPKLEEQYIDRYEEADAEMADLTEETLNLFYEPEVERRFETIKGPMDHLLALEERAFTLAREGRDSEALELLESPEYERYKQRYIEVLNATFAALEDAEERQRQRLETYQLALLGAAILGLALVFLGWAFAINTLIKRRRDEEEISRLASIMQNSADAVDSKTLGGTIVSLNPSAERLYGYSEEELKGKHISVLTPPERMDEMKAILESAERGDTVSDQETVRVSKDGRRIPLSLTVSPVRDKAGNVLGVSAIARDITERKLAEQELQQAKEQAEAANRAKSDFLANMSHEIKTPMNGVIGMTGLLLDTPLTEEQREYAETVRASADNLLTIINDILDFSKIEAGKMKVETIDFDLRAAVEESVGLLAERAHNKGLEIASLVKPDVPTALRGDPGRIRQVLVNLLGNAVKFTEEGEISLVVRLIEEKEDAALVRFEVKDTGIGMSEEQRSRLFRSFSQADASTTRKYGGTGLGLAISKQLVELMGGEIGVESAPGEGSTFWFALPLDKQPEGAQRRATPVPQPDLRGLRVLVVDDSETNRKIVHEQIASWGMAGDSVGDGPSALRALREAAGRVEPYDLAILDMEMPQMDGIELARRIKEDPLISSTKLVMASSVGRGSEAEEARRAGIEVYLTKPVRQSRLFDAIAMVMGMPAEDFSASSTSAISASSPTDDDSPLAATRATREEPKAGPRARLLVAEDNAVNQKVAAKMLEGLGYQADVVANGQEAVEALFSRVPYAAVLMDVQMPEMDGYEATAEIRRRQYSAAQQGMTPEPGVRRTPVIAMTANAMQGDREKALAAGMDDYVSKPVKPEELGAVLRRWIPQSGGEAPVPEEAADGPIPPVGITDPLDRNVLASLRELGDQELLSELAELFLEDVPPKLQALREAIGGGDATSVESVAHALKGSSGNMGALRMSTISTDLQDAGRSGELERALVLVERLEAEFGRVRSALEAEMNRSRG